MPLTRTLVAASVALLLCHADVRAQQPNANAGAFGMAGSFTAAARNYDAVAWNPANLALPGNSVASFIIGGIGGTTGLDPVTLRMIGKFNNTTIPPETKDAWLQLIGQGNERGRVDAGATWFAMSIKNVALQIGSSAYGIADVNQDAAEVLLYGNAGRTGSVRNYAFAGSNARGAAFTTAAASIGVPLPLVLTGAPDEIITLGLTGKYVLGNALGRAEDDASTITPANVDVRFPLVYGSGFDLGHGAGLDVGLAWHAGRMTAGLTMQNVVNSFAWDTTKLKTRLNSAAFDGTSSASSFVDTTYALAPAAMRAAVAAEKFGPTIAGGLAWQAADVLLLTADARVQTGDGIQIGPRSAIGAGAEFSGISFLPIRLGAAKITDGWQGAAGIGLRLGQNHVGVSATVRDQGTARATGAMLNLVAFY